MERRIKNRLRRGRNCVFLMHAHLVFVTKYRKEVFSGKHLKDLQKIFNKVCQDFGAFLREYSGEGEHVHLLVDYPPKVAVARLVNSLKGVSSRLLRRNFPKLKECYWKSALWSPSYFAGSCGGAPLDTIKQYIAEQHRLD